MGLRLLRRLLVALMLAAPVLAAPVAADPMPFSVAAENAMTGTPNWRISESRFTKRTLAFTDAHSVEAGMQLGLYVSCMAKTFTVDALRIGYYSGAGARRIWHADPTRCVRQPAAKVAKATRTAVAPWSRNLDIDTTDWPEGMYVLKVVSNDHSATYVDLIIRSTDTADKTVFVSSTLTFQAYNNWGGANTYRGRKGFSTRAYAVSYDRPQVWGLGSGKFMSYEAPLLTRAEAVGIPLAYVADTDIAADPTILEGARSIVFGGHAEYWTQSMRDAVIAARERGTNVLFFGANTAYWRVRISASELGSNRTMTVYKSRTLDPSKRATIRFRDLGQPDSQLTVVTYNCFPARGSFTVTKPTSWVFAGTGADKGESFKDIVATEIDTLQVKQANTTVLADSPTTCGARSTRSTMVLRTEPSGGFTFASGSMGWVATALRGDAPDRSVEFVQRVTDNLLLAGAYGIPTA